jgi:hypothetical protein
LPERGEVEKKEKKKKKKTLFPSALLFVHGRI